MLLSSLATFHYVSKKKKNDSSKLFQLTLRLENHQWTKDS